MPEVAADAADALPSEVTPKADAQPAARTTTSAAETSGFFQENMSSPSMWAMRGSAALMRSLSYVGRRRRCSIPLKGDERPLSDDLPFALPARAGLRFERYVRHRCGDIARLAAGPASASCADGDERAAGSSWP